MTTCPTHHRWTRIVWADGTVSTRACPECRELRLKGLHTEHLHGRPMASIAAELGITRERVRQLFAARRWPHGLEVMLYRRAARRFFGAVASVADLERRRAHGTQLRYQRGCRCPACRRAATAYCRAARERRGCASEFVCAACGASCWQARGTWRHWSTPRDRHAPEPVRRAA